MTARVTGTGRIAGAFAGGLLFACGLCLSGMTDPRRVLGFLDFFGRWDPTLAFVMAGAVGTHAVLARLVARRAAPVFGARFILPAREAIDARLVLGSVIFGVGWGLAGYCPGPAVLSVASGTATALLFSAAMVVGMAAHELVDPARRARRPDPIAAVEEPTCG